MTVLRIALAQLNPTVGDLDGNLAQLTDAYDQADEAGCDIVAFPELSTTGYPPEDLVLKPGFVADNRLILDKLAARTRRCAAVVGFVDEDRDLYNAAAVCANGDVLGTYRKRLLPNYAVFDEARYFTPGTDNDPLELYVIGGVKVGISICEDIWSPFGPLATQSAGGAELSININGSPYHWRKGPARERMIATRAADASSAIVYVNQVGGQDELVFDGGSLVFDGEGNLLARAPQFVEQLMIVDVPIPPVYRKRLLDPRGRRTEVELPLVHVSDAPRVNAEYSGVNADHPNNPIAVPLDPDRELYDALVLGTRDYCRKNGFTDVVIGLSGGIDSTLVAVHRRRRARPRTRARCVDAVALLERPLEVRRRICSPRTSASTTGRSRSSPAFQAYLDMLAPSFAGRQPGLTYENLQSRCRGQLLMALSNEFGWMVLTTGNKSEMAVGYFTIYGDSVGGYAVIKDVLKTRVYDLCRYVNRAAGRDVVPPDVITKPPSAELRPDQRDDQSLPPVRRARPDPRAVRRGRSHRGRDHRARPRRGRRAAGHTRSSTSPSTSAGSARPACGSAPKAFGKDRRMPITSGYRG